MSEQLKELLYVIDGMCEEFNSRNYGNASDWQQHIARKYEAYTDYVDENEQDDISELTKLRTQLNVATKLLDERKDENELLALYLADIRKASNNQVIRDLCELALEPYKASKGKE